MATTGGAGDRCPYRMALSGMAACPMFEARAIADWPQRAFVTCAHIRSAVTRPAEAGAAAYYPRCELMSAELALDAALGRAVLAEYSDDFTPAIGAG